MAYIEHPLAPVYDGQSRVLILGTMPSPKSREAGFYYSHPQNRFWKVLAALFNAPLPQSAAEKKALALSHGVALFDVLRACEIEGAADGSIKGAKPNDLSPVLSVGVVAVFTTGAAAARLYAKLCLPQTGMPAHALPSTSPANCRVSLNELIGAYSAILPYLEKRG